MHKHRPSPLAKAGSRPLSFGEGGHNTKPSAISRKGLERRGRSVRGSSPLLKSRKEYRVGPQGTHHGCVTFFVMQESGPRLLLGEDTVGLEHAGRQVKVGGYTTRTMITALGDSTKRETGMKEGATFNEDLQVLGSLQ